MEEGGNLRGVDVDDGGIKKMMKGVNWLVVCSYILEYVPKVSD